MSRRSAVSPMAWPTSCARSNGRVMNSTRSSSAAAPRAADWSARSSPMCAARRWNRRRPRSRSSRLRDGGRCCGQERRPWPPRCRRCRRWREAPQRRRAGRSRRSTRESGGPARSCAGRSEKFASSTRKSRWPEVVIFDCDGVLVDSEVIALAVTRRRLGEAGLRLTDEETRERFLGLRLNSVVRRIETELGAPLPKEFPGDLSREILSAFARELKGVEGVREAVGALARACLRRFFERAREAALRASGDRLRGAVRAQHLLRRRSRAGKAKS